MGIISNLSILFVALSHIGFLVLEMFLWDKPQGMKIFRHSPEHAKLTKVMAQNQGLYNGFLAAGLLWSLFADEKIAFQLANFVLICVAVAGVYGWMTVSTKILQVQALPALFALLAVHIF